jgi:hypothetical protein
MKNIRLYTLLALLLLAGGVTMQAQEINVTGMVSRVAAPYFEQNVCNDRFAIVSEGETYYVMVDNYWPNPYLEDLVIHYDTIPVGNEIEVKGTVVEMEDGNGESFSVIDIQKLVDAEYLYFNSRICWMGILSPIAYPGPDPVDAYAIINDNGDLLYFVAIDGELQTDYTSWMVNGVTINSTSQYIFVGTHEIWTDYYGEPFMVFNLKLAIPYGIVSDNIGGTLSLNNGLQCLSVYDGTNYYYLTIKDAMQHGFINPDLYEENTSVTVGGVETTRYDIFGNMFFSFEIAVLQSLEEKTLTGIMKDAPNPAIGFVPLPGMELAFFSGDKFYYLDNERVFLGPYGDIEAIIIGNDTLVNGVELTATFSSTMRIDNGFEPYYRIFISEAITTTELQEFSTAEIQVFPNPAKDRVVVEGIEAAEVQVYNALGQMVKTVRGTNEIDVADLVEGVYLVRIMDAEGKVYTNKITKR